MGCTTCGARGDIRFISCAARSLGVSSVGGADLVEITIDGDIFYSLIKIAVDGTVTIDGDVSNRPITVGDDAEMLTGTTACDGLTGWGVSIVSY